MIKEEIKQLLLHPEKLLYKKPFTRGADGIFNNCDNVTNIGDTVKAKLPNYRKKNVSQETFMNELDPNCHTVLFDENIPSICQKINDGSYVEIKNYRMSIPIQKCIKDKQVMHLAANPMQFTLMDINPKEEQREDFITFKQYWDLRNQEGMKYKMVDIQKSYGDAGLLYYMNRKGEIKSKTLSFADGYVLLPQNDEYGERIMECVYYSKDNVERLDCYDDTYMHTFTRTNETLNNGNDGWQLISSKTHGFNEIPLITKRGEVAWNNVQPIIESFEELYNVFVVIQKRWGWGILYIKGRFKDEAKKIAGSVVLNDDSIDGKGDAKFLTPPTPQGTIDTLNQMLESIQLGSSTTFILPKDIKMSGDVSGIAVQLTQSQDNELALQNVIDWQNVADKMVRLFKQGLAKELVNKGINDEAVTRFEKLQINAKFKVWRPLNEYEYNQMISTLVGAGILSKESGIELNTLSKPDEKVRVDKEEEKAQSKAQQTQQVEQQVNTQNTQEPTQE